MSKPVKAKISKHDQLMFLPHDDRIKSIIPDEWETAGRKGEFMSVPHTVEVSRLARNLGYKVPAPITHHYQWHDSPKPFRIQKITAALMTMNPRAYILNEMGCVDCTTEFLTPTGWKRFDDAEDVEVVAQYDPDHECIDFIHSNLFKAPCEDMIRFKTTRGVDQLLSPEHRVGYEDRGGNWRVDCADNIFRNYGSLSHGYDMRFRTAVNKVYNQPDVEPYEPTEPALRVQIAFMADGTLRGDCHNGYVRLKKQRKKERLRKLLDAAGIEYEERPCKPEGFSMFKFRPPLMEKHYDGKYWQLPHELLEVVADEVWRWDGSARKAGRKEFYSSHKPDADFIQYVFTATGRRTVMAEGRPNEWRVGAKAGSHLVGLFGKTSQGTALQNTWWEKSPDGFKYCFTVPTGFLLLRRNGCIFATGNTGKTRSAMYAVDYLIREGVLNNALIVAPLSTLSPVWDREIFEFFPHLSTTVLHGSRAQRVKALREKHHIYIINHDGVGTILPELLEKKIDAVLIDEVGAYRNKSTNRWKQMDKLVRAGRGVKYLWGMTGSPTPNEPTDAFGLAKLLTPERAPRWFKEFQRDTMTQVTQFKWIPKSDANDKVYDMLQPAVRYKRDDCVELPETSYQDIEIDPSKQVADTYKKMMNALRIAFEEGQITAANEGVLFNKLLQISCGWVYTAKKDVVKLDNQDRVNEVKNLINDSLGKVIVFANFTHAAEGLYDRITQGTRKIALPKGGVELVTGATSKKERDRIFSSFQNDEYPRVIVAHPECMSHGLTLTAASTIIWFTPTTSLETYEQANARITRPGQKHKGLILHLQSTSIERKLYNRLKQKAKTQGALLELFNDN